MTPEFKTSVKYHIDNNDGYSFIVSEDIEGFNCVQLTYCEKNKTETLLTVSPNGAREIANALLKCADEVEKKK